MARPKRREKEPLELLGIKIDPVMKRAIEDESDSLRIAAGTYARQLLILGWQMRHEAPVAKNPREQILIDRFNELPVGKQEDVLAMVEALHEKYMRSTPVDDKEVVEKLFKGKPAITPVGEN